MLIAFNYAGTTYVSNSERQLRANRCQKLLKLFYEEYTDEQMQEVSDANRYYVINGDKDELEVWTSELK